MTLNKYVVLGLIIIAAVGIFFLGRNSNTYTEQPKLPDNKRELVIIDSMQKSSKKREDSIKISYVIRDKERLNRKINNEKTKKEAIKIQNFTDVELMRYDDSVLVANGLK